MNIRMNVSIAIAAILITLIAAYVTTVNSTNTQVKHYDGITYVETQDAGLVAMTPESYDFNLSGNIETIYAKYAVAIPVKHTPANDTPSMLPPTSAPHGDVTCTVIDANGNSYTVTRDSCDSL
jgi:hypothetical protein